MKKNLHIFSIFLTIILIGCQCKKAIVEPQLPAITQIGINTFGCKVNGKVWITYWPCTRLVAGSTELNYIIEPINVAHSLPISFSLNAGNINDGESLFLFYNTSVNINSTINIYDSLKIHYFGPGGFDYMNYPAQPGDTSDRYFQITKLDTVNKVVSGVFAFTLYTPVANNTIDSVIVTEGRFDLKIGEYSRCTQ